MEFNEKGPEWLKQEVANNDPAYFGGTDQNNPQRLMRALEIFRSSGKPYSSFLKNNRNPEKFFTPIFIFLNHERQILYERINKRVDNMMEKGLLEEVRNLLPYRDYNAMKTVGYRELVGYFDGNYGLEEAIDKIKQHTRNYAKRQITWFKNSEMFESFLPEQEKEIISYIDRKMSCE